MAVAAHSGCAERLSADGYQPDDPTVGVTSSQRQRVDLARKYNPYIQGWISYYGHLYGAQLRPVLQRIDAYVIRCSRRKFKQLLRRTKGARDWFARVRRVNPTLFACWRLCYGNG